MKNNITKILALPLGTKVPCKLATTHSFNLFSNYSHFQPSFLDLSTCFLPFKCIFHFQIMLAAVIDKQKCHWLNIREVYCLLTSNPRQVVLLQVMIQGFRILPSCGLTILNLCFPGSLQRESEQGDSHVEVIVGQAWRSCTAERGHITAHNSRVFRKKRTQVWCPANYSVPPPQTHNWNSLPRMYSPDTSFQNQLRPCSIREALLEQSS